MANYTIAGLTVEIRSRYQTLPRLLSPFLCAPDARPDLTVEVSESELEKERAGLQKEFSPGYIESICAYRKLCLQMPRFQGMFLHCSLIRVREKGIAFLATSGTGKTTHTSLWQRLLGEEMTVINGDKPILRKCGEVFWGYGTPWAGKEGVYAKDSVPVTDLCFLERAEENSCEPLDPGDCLSRIVHQVILPTDPQGAAKTLELLDSLLRSCRTWRIRCNMDIDAARVAYDTIFK